MNMTRQLSTALSAWLGTEEAALRYEAALNKVAPTDVAQLRGMTGNVRMMSGSSMSAGESACMDEVDYMAYVVDGIGVIEINGVLTKDYASYNQYIGMVSYEEIAASASAIKTLKNSGALVNAVILKVNTPGGDANGIEQASSALKDLAKTIPVYTHTDKEMCSAGYWLGCNAQEIWATKMANVGSIGVVMVLRTMADALKMAGMKVRVLREGQHKAALNPYEEPKEEDLAFVQTQLGIMYQMFLAQVADNRNTSVKALAEGPGQGQVFLGIQAVKEGLIDQLGSFESLVKALRTKYAPGKSGGTSGKSSAHSGGTPVKMFKIGNKTFQLNATGIAAVAAGLSEDEAAKDAENLQEVVEQTGEEAAQELAAQQAEEQAAAEQAAAEALAQQQAVNLQSQQPAATAADVSSIMQMAGLNATLTADLAVAKLRMQEMEVKLSSAQADNQQLRVIAIKATNKMEIALRTAPSKSADFDSDAAIVAKFSRVEADFNTHFKAGAKAEHSNHASSTTVGATTAVDTSAASVAAQNLTKIGGQGR